MSIIVGLDVGYGNTKMVWGPRHVETPQSLVMPSGSAPIRSLPVLPNGKADLCGGVPVLVDGDSWVAGVESHRLSNYTRVLSEDFTTSKEWIALVHGALASVKVPRVDHVLAGLPVAEFYRGDTGAKLKARLEGVHQIRSGEVVEVMKATILPQPCGAFADDMRTRVLAAAPTQSIDHMTLVVDPGHYSVDWVILQNGSVLHHSSSSSKMAGQEMLNATVKLMYQQTQLRVSVDRLEAAVRRGDASIRAGKTDVPIAPFFEQAGGELVEQVIKVVAGKISGRKDDINTVIIAGGGANLYRKKIAMALPSADIVVPVNPILSNARGFWVAGLGAQ